MNNKNLKFNNIQQMLRCPICENPMVFSEGSFACTDNHCFDVSSKGYINFVPRQKALKGYDKNFFENRQKFLEQGFYDHILEAVVGFIPSSCNTIIDAGCGEGFYASEILKSKIKKKETTNDQTSLKILAFDISKEAVKIASTRSKDVFWLTADLANIPIKNHRTDCILNIFTPANYSEFKRILKKRGILIKAIPGPNHLIELREAVSENLQSKSESSSQTAKYFTENFNCKHRKIIGKKLSLSPEQLQFLLHMTPLLFSTDIGMVDFTQIKNVTIEAEILVGKS